MSEQRQTGVQSEGENDTHTTGTVGQHPAPPPANDLESADAPNEDWGLSTPPDNREMRPNE